MRPQCPTCGCTWERVRPRVRKGRLRSFPPRHHRGPADRSTAQLPSVRLHWPLLRSGGWYSECPDQFHRTGPFGPVWGISHPAETVPAPGVRRRIDRRAWAGKKALDGIVHKVHQGKDRR